MPLQRAVSYKGSFSQYLADFRCRARARARAARPGQPGRAAPARPGSLYKGRFPTRARFPVLSRFSMPCARTRGQASLAGLGWHGSRLCGYSLLWDLVFLYLADSRYPGMGALAPITRSRLLV